MNERPIAVRLQGVSVRYNEAEEQLRGIDLTVYAGECIVLTGPSGSGKSTLLRLLNGLIPHYYEGSLEGEIELFGRSAAHLPGWAFSRLSGSVFQDSRTQFFNAVVRDEIAFSGENLGMRPDEIHDRLQMLDEELDLRALFDAQVQSLSGGEKQKVAFAAARLAQPQLLLLDEPSANLDLAAAANLSRLLQRLKEEGQTLVVAEHRLYELLPIADRIVYMEDGKIQTIWTAAELLALDRAEREARGLRASRFEHGINASNGKVSWAGGGSRQRDAGRERARNGGLLAEADTELPGTGGTECLAIEGLSVGLNRRTAPVLEKLGFVLQAGEIVALSGPNGAGKSTLAKTICGLLRERAGSVSLHGKPARARERLGRIGFVMQDSDCQLFADSVLGELLLTREQNQEAPAEAQQLLQELGLWELRDRHPVSLSGGQKQRLALASGLMGKPDVLILDEPTSGLDGRNMHSVAQLLRRVADSGTAILVITHDHELIGEGCDRLIVLGEGRLCADVRVKDQACAAELHRLRDL